jgi:hypothetical protein
MLHLRARGDDEQFVWVAVFDRRRGHQLSGVKWRAPLARCSLQVVVQAHADERDLAPGRVGRLLHASQAVQVGCKLRAGRKGRQEGEEEIGGLVQAGRNLTESQLEGQRGEEASRSRACLGRGWHRAVGESEPPTVHPPQGPAHPRAAPALTCVVMTRPLPWWPATLRASASSTTRSLVVRPGDSTLVESLMNSVTPSRPAGGGAWRRVRCRVGWRVEA